MGCQAGTKRDSRTRDRRTGICPLKWNEKRTPHRTPPRHLPPRSGCRPPQQWPLLASDRPQASCQPLRRTSRPSRSRRRVTALPKTSFALTGSKQGNTPLLRALQPCRKLMFSTTAPMQPRQEEERVLRHRGFRSWRALHETFRSFRTSPRKLISNIGLSISALGPILFSRRLLVRHGVLARIGLTDLIPALMCARSKLFGERRSQCPGASGFSRRPINFSTTATIARIAYRSAIAIGRITTTGIQSAVHGTNKIKGI